jgi:hypothetical protein
MTWATNFFRNWRNSSSTITNCETKNIACWASRDQAEPEKPSKMGFRNS